MMALRSHFFQRILGTNHTLPRDQPHETSGRTTRETGTNHTPTQDEPHMAANGSKAFPTACRCFGPKRAAAEVLLSLIGFGVLDGTCSGGLPGSGTAARRWS